MPIAMLNPIARALPALNCGLKLGLVKIAGSRIAAKT